VAQIFFALAKKNPLLLLHTPSLSLFNNINNMKMYPDSESGKRKLKEKQETDMAYEMRRQKSRTHRKLAVGGGGVKTSCSLLSWKIPIKTR
jgi:hypothetical protein